MTEKSLKYHILEYCKFINEHENTFYIQSEADDKGCVKYKSFAFRKSPKSTFQTLLSYFDNQDTGIVDHFVLKYHYKKENYSSPIQCSNHTPNLDYVIFSSLKLNGKHETNLIRNGSKRYQFFIGIINELEEYFEKYKKEHGKDSFTNSKELSEQYNTTVYEIDRIHYDQINPLRDYCKKQQHELMGGNYSSLAISKENFEKFTLEFCKLVNDSNTLESLVCDKTYKDERITSMQGITTSIKVPISEDYIIKKDETLYPFKLRYMCDNNCSNEGNTSYIELYPYYFVNSPMKFTISNIDKNFHLFMNIRDNLREISKKGGHYLSDKKRELIKKSCNKFEKDLPTRVEKKHKKTDLNITNNKNLNSIMDQIINSNRTNGITPHYFNSTNISPADLTHFNNITSTNSLIATDSNTTDNKNLNSTMDQIINSNRTNGITPHYFNSTNISPADLTHFNNITSTNSLIVTDSNRIVPNHLSTKDLPTKIVNKHKKTDLNTTNNKHLNSTIDKKVLELEYEDSLAFVTNKITSSNRANKIASGYYVNNIAKNNSQFNLFIYNDTLRASPPLITERTNSTWLIPLIGAGGVISLVVIGIFTMFKRKQSRHQTQNTKEHIPSSEKRNSEEKHSSVQLEDYSLRRSRSSTSLKSRRYTLSSPESIEKLNTEKELPNGVIVDPNQESCAFIIQPSSGV